MENFHNRKEVNPMIEANMIYDLLPGADLQAYQEWAKKATGLVLQSPGLIEFRANRSVLGNPQVRATTVWKSLADWANYNESAEWQGLWNEMLAFATNVSVELWGPSPVLPEPLRPGQ